MNVKSILIGVALVAVGITIGLIINCKCCEKSQKCNTEMVQHHGDKDGKPGCDKPKCPMKRMNDEVLSKLNLTAEQQSKVDAIFEAKREAMKAEREKTHTAIKAVLTPDQQKQFDELVAKCCPKEGECKAKPGCEAKPECKEAEKKDCCKK